MDKKIIALAILILIIVICACNEPGIPKPRSYFRITLPEKEYAEYSSGCPFMFKYPTYANVSVDEEYDAEPCWLNINFPSFKAKIHISYKPVNNDLNKLLEDAHTLVYKHVIKADAINETQYENDSLHVYGILYEIKGNAASSVQFYLTDSVANFVRGSLYFNVYPNKDSLKPVIEFIEEDIVFMMESFEWK